MSDTGKAKESKKIWDSALELLWQKSRFTSYFYQSVQFAVDDSIPTLGLTSSDYRPLIIYNPDFVISKNKEELHKLLFELRDKFGLTIVIVTHDKELAQLSDRVIEMKDGKIELTMEN